MNIKYIICLLLANSCYSQSLSTGTGSLFETYKTTLGGVTNSSVFRRTFQEFNYRKSHRGIEVYETYHSKNYYNSTMLQKSIFSKPMPSFIINKNGEVYETYRYKVETQPYNSFNNSIFQKTGQRFIITEESRPFLKKENSLNTTKPGLSYDPDVDIEPIER